MRITEYVYSFINEKRRIPKIGFVGIGDSNIALLCELGNMRVSLRSEVAITADLPRARSEYDVREGSGYLGGIYEDILFLSPSVRRDKPELLAAERGGVWLCSDAELFFKNNSSEIYAVTGSDGKSTTSTLAAMLLKESHADAEAIGNIGVPFAVARARCAVAELSSFQLSYLAPRVNGALITGITPNHLNWHTSIDEYIAAKLNVFTDAERTVISPDTKYAAGVAASGRHSAVYSVLYSQSELRATYPAEEYFYLDDGCIAKDGERILDTALCNRRERYNLHNLMGAVALTWGKFSSEQLMKVAESFSGLEHRCERFLSVGGVDFINSSIDTSPARTCATLDALCRPVRIIIGGRGKGLSVEECIPTLTKYAARISLYGEAGEEYLPALQRAGIAQSVECELFARFDDAVEHACEGVRQGDTVLLSPMATGYGEFSSFAERGIHFKEYLRKKYLRT